MGQLFGKDKRTISEHIGNIFSEGELDENSVVRNFRTTAADGKNYATNAGLKPPMQKVSFQKPGATEEALHTGILPLSLLHG